MLCSFRLASAELAFHAQRAKASEKSSALPAVNTPRERSSHMCTCKDLVHGPSTALYGPSTTPYHSMPASKPQSCLGWALLLRGLEGAVGHTMAPRNCRPKKQATCQNSGRYAPKATRGLQIEDNSLDSPVPRLRGGYKTKEPSDPGSASAQQQLLCPGCF